jgi:hypothetical protein
VISRLLGRTASFTQGHPQLTLLAVCAVSVLLYANTRNLQLRTDLGDLMGRAAPEARVLKELIQEFGYGSRFFLLIEAGGDSELDAEQMEDTADRLVSEMQECGSFTYARSGLSAVEMLQVARYFVDNFPAFVDPAYREQLAERVGPSGVRTHIRRMQAGLLTPFSALGTDYFVIDPLGLMEFTDRSAREAGEFAGFDLEWGSGGRFFSKDHRTLLVIAEPRLPATDYEFSVKLMSWVRERTRAALAERGTEDGPMLITPVGAHAYAEQSRQLIQHNIRVASVVSVISNLLLCVCVYRWLPALILAFLPSALAILWTIGLISTYPGEINLISLAFIAIIVGLGDDQVTYFFTRVPRETAGGRSLGEAIRQTYVTTGKSALFCILTTSTGTLALALVSFKGLAELGVALTIGLLMLLVHTLITVPALMHLLWPVFPVRLKGEPFRILPALARVVGTVVADFPRRVLATGIGVLLVAGAAIPFLRVSNSLEGLARYDDPAFVGQRLLAARFGLEGAPMVLFVKGTERDVLDRTARLQTLLDPLRRSGQLRAVLGPTSLVPSPAQQDHRGAVLAGLDFNAAALALRQAIEENGLNLQPFESSLATLRRWGSEARPAIGVDAARQALPMGMLDTSIRRLGPGRYVGAVTLSSANPEATASLPASTLASLKTEAGPFEAYSYDKIAVDFHSRVVRDSRTASLATLAGVIIIVAVLFRNLSMSLLVLLPIACGVVGTVGILVLVGHQFTGMAFTAFPLIVGIGIDNGIHLVRRHLETPRVDVRELLAASGPAVIQTNLTTIVGFSALLSTTFPPLVELGLVTAVGMGVTLLASVFLIPAILSLRGADRPN